MDLSNKSKISQQEMQTIHLLEEGAAARIDAHEKAVIKQQLHESKLGIKTKDIILPAAPNEELYSSKAPKKALQAPASDLASPQDGDLGTGEGTSVIALIGTVLALQAKINSNYWSTLWKQASDSMALSVEIAPILAQNVKDNWDSQAAATREEGSIARGAGIASVTAGTAAIAMGGWQAVSSIREEMAEVNAAKTPLEGETSPQATEAVQNLKENDQNLSGKLTRSGKAGIGIGKAVMKGLGKGLEKTLTTAQASVAFANGMNQLTVEAPGKKKIAKHQEAAGAADAQAKMNEQYTSYYDKDFSRTNEMNQGTSQNIDYAMNILKSLSDSLTQVVVSMFRG